MSNLIEYEFYDGEYSSTIDHEKEIVTMYERGGWSRSYHLTFKDLAKYAEQWDIALDLSQDDENIAKIGTNIILANHAVEHGLDPFRYVSKSKKITHPKDLETIQKFEELFQKYDADKILDILKVKINFKTKKSKI